MNYSYLEVFLQEGISNSSHIRVIACLSEMIRAKNRNMWSYLCFPWLIVVLWLIKSSTYLFNFHLLWDFGTSFFHKNKIYTTARNESTIDSRLHEVFIRKCILHLLKKYFLISTVWFFLALHFSKLNVVSNKVVSSLRKIPPPTDIFLVSKY